MLISTSITRSKGRYTQSFEPPLSLYVKQAIGAAQAANFDLSNACAGMLTGVFILQDLVARGEINCGMVVSGEYISHLSWNAARQIRSLFSKQLALLTLGDAGAAVIVERAPSGCGVDVIGFTTLAEHSRLCLAFPSTAGPGAQMYTKSRTLQKVAIDDMAPLVAEAIGEAGIDLADIDFMIPHQTSARAIRAGTQEFVRRLGARPKHVVVNLEEFGNTSSTTLFVALHKYLEEQRIHKGDRVMLQALASRRGVRREGRRRHIMHPMFVMLFIETDAYDLLTEERDRKRRASAARRGRSVRVVRAAANPDRPRRSVR